MTVFWLLLFGLLAVAVSALVAIWKRTEPNMYGTDENDLSSLRELDDDGPDAAWWLE